MARMTTRELLRPFLLTVLGGFLIGCVVGFIYGVATL